MKVYSVVIVLLIAGYQVPVILLIDVDGNSGKVSRIQIVPISVNVGMIKAVTVTTIVASLAH